MSSENPMQGEISLNESTEDRKLANDFLHRYTSLTEKHKNNLLGQNDFFCRILGSIPIIGYIFRWNPVRARRNSFSGEQKVLKPGILSSKCIFEGLTMNWIKYLDYVPSQDEEFSLLQEYQNEYINVGLLSALILQIIPNFLLYDSPEFDGDSINVKSYRMLCAGALTSLLLSTAVSIMYLIMLGCTGGTKEANYFIKILDDNSFGMGSHGPLLLLYLGALMTIAFLGLFYYKRYEPVVYNGVLPLAFVLLLFGALFYFHAVGSLYAAKVTQAMIQVPEKVSISIIDIKKHLKDFTQKKKGIENIESVDELIKYIRENNGNKHSLTKTCKKVIEEVFEQALKRQIKESW